MCLRQPVAVVYCASQKVLFWRMLLNPEFFHSVLPQSNMNVCMNYHFWWMWLLAVVSNWMIHLMTSGLLCNDTCKVPITWWAVLIYKCVLAITNQPRNNRHTILHQNYHGFSIVQYKTVLMEAIRSNHCPLTDLRKWPGTILKIFL